MLATGTSTIYYYLKHKYDILLLTSIQVNAWIKFALRRETSIRFMEGFVMVNRKGQGKRSHKLKSLAKLRLPIKSNKKMDLFLQINSKFQVFVKLLKKR